MTGFNSNGASVNSSFTNSASNGECASWLELESDPGLFTLLIDDFGVKGVQVEEIYDLTKPLDSSIFGFIFLFKWIERRSRRSKSAGLDATSNFVTDPNLINKMFFAHQIVPNSCATHALLSILLNCKPRKYFDLGELLSKFQSICEGMSPEVKGLAIGNQPKLAEAHNSYAKPETSSATTSKISSSSTSSLSSSNRNNKSENSNNNATTSAIASSSASSSCSFVNSQSNSNNLSLLASSISSTSNTSNEIFHFICFVPINGRLYELDGLKPYPIDHGPINTNFSNNFYYYDNSINGDDFGSTPSPHSNLANLLLNATNLSNNANSNWTNKFKQIIKQRLSSFNSGHTNHEIRFNLMAVVPDRMSILREKINLMNENRTKLNKFLLNDENIANSQLIRIKNEMNDANDENNQNSNENNINRQLRSTNSSSTLLKTNKSSNFNKSDFDFEIRFGLNSNDIVNELMVNFNKNNVKLKTNISIDQLIENSFDLNELSKLFKIDKIIDLNQTEDKNDDNHEEEKDTSTMIKKYANLEDLKVIDSKLKIEIESDECKYNDEVDKRKKYKIDALRRKHVYDEFIVTYLKILSENGKLAEIVKTNLLATGGSSSTSTQSNNCSSTSPLVQNHNNCIINSSLFLQQPSNAKRPRKR